MQYTGLCLHNENWGENELRIGSVFLFVIMYTFAARHGQVSINHCIEKVDSGHFCLHYVSS